MADLSSEQQRRRDGDLLAIEQIKNLKARYCLLLDAQEWDALARLFTPDATFSVGSGEYPSTQAFVENLRRSLTGESHVHIAQMPIIELTAPDRARGLWTFSNRTALGHYDEEYARLEGAWRICSPTMTWIIPPSEQLLRERKGAFAGVADRWRALAVAWGSG